MIYDKQLINYFQAIIFFPFYFIFEGTKQFKIESSSRSECYMLVGKWVGKAL